MIILEQLKRSRGMEVLIKRVTMRIGEKPVVRSCKVAKVALVGVIWLALTTASLSAATYNAVASFSLASNPNGTWSYGTLASYTGGIFTPMTATFTNEDYVGQNDWTNGLPLPNNAVIEQNASGMTQSIRTSVQTVDVLRLDGESLIDDVRWTAPIAGMYNIAGRFQHIDTLSVSVDNYIVLNGTTTLFAASGLMKVGDQYPYDLNVSLPSGATLDFEEGGAQFYDDSTGLAAIITSVPETAVMPAVFCIAGLSFCRGRKFRNIVTR